MKIKSIVFGNPFFKKYENHLEFKNLNRINILFGKNNSGKTTILKSLTNNLDRLNSANKKIIEISIELKIKDLVDLTIEIIEGIKVEDKHIPLINHFEDIKRLYFDNQIKIIILLKRDLKLRKIVDFTYKSVNERSDEVDTQFYKMFEELFQYHNPLKSNIFDQIIRKYKKIFISSNRLLEPGENFTDRPLPDINNTIDKILSNRVFSETIQEEDAQNRFDVFKIPHLTMVLEYIKRGEILERYQEFLGKSFIDNFNKSLNKFFPNYEIETSFKLKLTQAGQKVLEDGYDVGGWRNLGHGHQELISLLFLIALPGDYIYFIDEPDIGLHPELQTMLLNFINELVSEEKHNKLFFFATHSSCFIDFNLKCSHYLCSKNQMDFNISLIKKEDLSLIRNELGFTPSSLFQAPGVIWVEGPSEYSYVRLLFECFDFDLDKYGILIIPYFGVGNLITRKLSFKKLNSINQNFMIIMDSDKKGEKLNPPGRRLNTKKFFDDIGIFFWLIESTCDIEGFLPQPFLNEYYNINIQKDGSHIKPPYIKLVDYIKLLKKKCWISQDAPIYEKNRDSSEFRSIILEDQVLKEEISKKREVRKNIRGMIKIITSWMNIPNVNDFIDENYESFDKHPINPDEYKLLVEINRHLEAPLKITEFEFRDETKNACSIKNGHVRDLHIEDYHIGNVLKSFNVLQNLELLVLIKMNITSVPESFSDLEELIELDLSNNNIKRISTVFNNLDKLKYINLEGNPLEMVEISVDFLSDLDFILIDVNQVGAFKGLLKKAKSKGYKFDNFSIKGLSEEDEQDLFSQL